MVRSTRLLVAIAAFAVAGAIPLSASGQSFRTKPVRVIMPAPVGSGPDAVMRIVGEKLGRIWNQQVIIENRPGGNGFIALTAAKRDISFLFTFQGSTTTVFGRNSSIPSHRTTCRPCASDPSCRNIRTGTSRRLCGAAR